ncbi:MAG: hypothetical protein JWO66_2196 [Candidatus Eremiobacteraeota bacterium]|jgi:hypothetical protein|nr:hypothetical protein [Candidatus Eremiobacteraeota bacterium]
MTSNSTGPVRRGVLDRILGVGYWRVSDSSVRGFHRHVRYGCGCSGEEREHGGFAVDPCPLHREALEAAAHKPRRLVKLA